MYWMLAIASSNNIELNKNETFIKINNNNDKCKSSNQSSTSASYLLTSEFNE